jgi:hypothetical protein
MVWLVCNPSKAIPIQINHSTSNIDKAETIKTTNSPTETVHPGLDSHQDRQIKTVIKIVNIVISYILYPHYRYLDINTSHPLVPIGRCRCNTGPYQANNTDNVEKTEICEFFILFLIWCPTDNLLAIQK